MNISQYGFNAMPRYEDRLNIVSLHYSELCWCIRIIICCLPVCFLVEAKCSRFFFRHASVKLDMERSGCVTFAVSHAAMHRLTNGLLHTR